FHVQKGLWIAMAMPIAVVGFEGYSRLVTGDHETDFIAYAMVSACVIAFIFLIVSAALLFAGEEEAGTALWLRQLPLKTSTLIGAKLVASIVGTLALPTFAVLTLIIAGLFWGDAGIHLPRFTILPRLPFFRNTSTEVLQCWATAIVTLFSVAVVYSLILRKVFPALGCWAVTAFVYTVVVLRTNGGLLSPAFLWTIPVATMLVIPLGYRWHVGRHRWFRRRVPSLPLSATSRQFLAKTFPTFARVYSQPSRRLMLPSLSVRSEGSLLRRSTAIPTVLGRTVAVLAWREMRFAVRFVAIALLLGTVAIAARGPGARSVPWPSMLIFLLVIECGLRTFRHDQQKLHGLFWSHRGVSPLLVWLVRNAVWLSALCFVSVAFLLGDLLPEMLNPPGTNSIPGHSSGISDIISQIHRPTLPTVSVADDLLFQVNVTLALLVGTFAINQLASCWIRRPILAACAGLYGTVSLWFWLSYLIHTDIPLVISAWPMIGLCFVAMVISRRDWMDRRTSLQIGLKRAAMIVVPCLCMWRMLQWL
ncbi:MAG: hypothetical protein ABGZ53_08920, partial [Fuerstiella sp.]